MHPNVTIGILLPTIEGVFAEQPPPTPSDVLCVWGIFFCAGNGRFVENREKTFRKKIETHPKSTAYALKWS